MSSDEGSVIGDRLISDDEVVEDDILQLIEGENNTEEVERDETADGEGEAQVNEDGAGERVVVKPKRVIRNPQPKLNSETLKGPRGIAALPSYFERIKWKGKGYEHQDLNAIIKTYEYWCHRLFPKFPFDTCIERLEKLGTKKEVQTHIKRIRFDLLFEDTPIVDTSDEENNVDGFVDSNQERQSVQQDVEFDQLLATSIPSSINTQSTTLSAEQLEKIRLNKEKAEKLRQERLRKIQEKALGNLEASNDLPGSSGVNNMRDEDFDVLSTQNSLSPQENDHEEPTFDLESNIRGKATLTGNTVKKKGRKMFTDREPEIIKEHSIVQNHFQSKQTDNDNEGGIHSGESDKNISTTECRLGNVIDSDSDDANYKIKSSTKLGQDIEKSNNSLYSYEKSSVENKTALTEVNGHSAEKSKVVEPMDAESSETHKALQMDIDQNFENKENASAETV